MATKPTKSTDTKVTRIKASDASEPRKSSPRKPRQAVDKPAAEPKAKRRPLRAFGGYFTGAWYELRQVHWPNRRATWSMTLALILFTAFFVVVILLLDALFQYLFKLTLG